MLAAIPDMGVDGTEPVVLHSQLHDKEATMNEPSMPIDTLDDKIAAAAFRRLVTHLQHRTDAQNVDLMGLAGFCRNCLSDWIAEAADGSLDKESARFIIYGMPQSEWKGRYQTEATPEQLARMAESVAKNRR
jgi:uncharacterized protein